MWYENILNLLIDLILPLSLGITSIIQALTSSQREKFVLNLQADINKQASMNQARVDLSKEFLSKQMELAIEYARESSVIEQTVYNLLPVQVNTVISTDNFELLKSKRSNAHSKAVAFMHKFESLSLFVSEDTFRAINHFQKSCRKIIDLVDDLLLALNGVEYDSQAWHGAFANILGTSINDYHEVMGCARKISLQKIRSELRDIKEYVANDTQNGTKKKDGNNHGNRIVKNVFRSSK